MRRTAGVALALGMIVLPFVPARAQDDAAAVEIHDNYFSPAEIHVVEGGTVTWTDLGGAHSVTSDDGISFDSSPGCIAGLQCMATGDTFSHQFRAPETIGYHCRVHGDAMVGKVIVDAATTTTSSTTSTSTTLANTTTSSDASGASGAPPGSDRAPTLSTFALPSLPSSARGVALPRASTRSTQDDDMRPWALVAVAIAGITTLAGVILVRRGRVPFG